MRKLSDILELGLRSRTDSPDDRFMCHNLNELEEKKAISEEGRYHAMQAVRRILKGNGTLWGHLLDHPELLAAHGVDQCTRTPDWQRRRLNDEFYIWWIFDLRRKGL